MNDQAELLKKIRAAAFTRNNGQVLRTVNILRHKYVSLRDIRCAVERDMDERQYLDCINFLSEAEYIHLRDISSRQPVELSDADYVRLEAKVTEKGIRLLGGELSDKMVDT